MAELKLQKILKKIDCLQLNCSYLSQLKLPNSKINSDVKVKSSCYQNFLIGMLTLSVTLGIWWIYYDILNKSCVLPLPPSTKVLFRPPEDCSMCSDVDHVVRLANLTPQQFEQLYAYGTTPVIVTDGTAGWKAIQEFDFKFFVNFYRNTELGAQINDCFFFPYKSGLRSLSEVLSMDEERANLSGQPWYVGWSTCYEEETRKLRSFYSRPYFLPETAESDMVDWIFMGGPGQGAHMHVDSVRHTSWQAQVRGRKRWQLAPPPECLYSCVWINFTVHPGEILVVDTNRWYHQTSVLPGDISITIGAEYD